jgi:hypothetical protein
MRAGHLGAPETVTVTISGAETVTVTISGLIVLMVSIHIQDAINASNGWSGLLRLFAAQIDLSA